MTRQDIFSWKRRIRLKRCPLAAELATYKPYVKVSILALQEEETGEDLWKKHLGIVDKPANYSKVTRHRQLELKFEP